MDVRNTPKETLRAACKARRAALDTAFRGAADEALCKRVLHLPAFVEAEVVFSYLSFGSEVSTRGLIEAAWEAGKTVALPFCVPHTRTMRWYRTTSFESLVTSSFGIQEPVPDEQNEIAPNASARSVALVPALTFDRSCHRLGYGGGFYDAFLATFGGTSIGVCYDTLMREDLAAEGALEPHDRPVQLVVTERRMFVRA